MHAELISKPDSDEFVPAVLLEPDEPPPKPLIRRMFSGAVNWLLIKPFRLASLVIILAILSSVPLLQLVALGYLLEVSARIARSGRMRDGLFLLDQAGTIGVAAGVVFLFGLPIQLMSNWAFASELVNPGSGQPTMFRFIGSLFVVIVAAHVGWVWFRGNPRWWSYLRPRPIEFATNIWRPNVWVEARDRLWEFCASLQVGELFWLGARGMFATLLWLLIPGLILVGTIEQGTTGVAGLFGFLGLAMMAVILLYLPYLQVRFATENRFKAMFEVRPIRQYFRASPVFFFLGLATTFVFSIPLYLLKVEATPQEVTWAPCILMVAFVLPARLMTGFAMGRAMRRQPKHGKRYFVLRNSMRLLCFPIIAGYLLFVFLSGFTSWDGLNTWFQQHALLIPVPFQAGV